MSHSLYWTYAFNIVVNSLPSFLTTILLIEFFLFLFRIKQPRIKAICRALPFFKICVDLVLYQHANWALLHEVNPLLAEVGTRQLAIIINPSALKNPFAGIQFSMQDGKTFSLADVIALSIDPFWVQVVVITAFVGASFALLRYLIMIFREKQRVAQIVQASHPIVLPVQPPLAAWMHKKRITLATSTAIDSPCIAGKIILFPAVLIDALSQEEREAVIAHEIAHCQWKDCGLRLACAFVGALFWWTASGWWQKRVEEMQEQAADTMVDRFEISRCALAQAVLKTARQAKEMPPVLTFPFVGRQLRLQRRMQKILREPIQPMTRWGKMRYGLLFCILLSVVFAKLWIF
jgi:beta-lactamase regulating signal transducer with metallopeptidase domain